MRKVIILLVILLYTSVTLCLSVVDCQNKNYDCCIAPSQGSPFWILKTSPDVCKDLSYLSDEHCDKKTCEAVSGRCVGHLQLPPC